MVKIKIVFILSVFVTLTALSACNKHIAAQKSNKQYYYSCPMHTEVFEMKPGKCPKCGMTLEQWDMDNYSQKKSSGSHSSHSDSGSHSGGCH